MTHHVAVIGGGPAGLIAAEVIAKAGVGVTIYEHRRSVGRKFLLAGRGGLNITHAEPLDDLLGRYGSARGRLEPAIRAFPPEQLREWCAAHGEETFVGTSDRVFPASFRATPLLRSWLRRLAALGVTIETGHRWIGWNATGDNLFEVSNADAGETFAAHADATIFALGGASWPRVGSDGGWVTAFEAGGIAVSSLQAANCGVTVGWTDIMSDRFAGTPIKNAVFSVGTHSTRGDAMMTTDGVEGGPIYALGPTLRHALAAGHGPAELVLDLHPDVTEASLAERLSKRRSKASATSWLHSAGVAAVSVALAREVTNNQMPSDAAAMAALLKRLPVTIADMAPIDRAISTAGGVSFDDLDGSYMIIDRPGVFVAGEMLDWEAPTGGYLLQACFSTGVAAAHGVLAWFANDSAN